MRNFFDNIHNSVDFFFRKNIKYSRKGYKVLNEDKAAFLGSLSSCGAEKERNFLHKYKLNYLKDDSTVLNYAMNLYVIELLEQNFNNKVASAKILDIGSKDWFYAAGEYSFFKHLAKEIELTGIEIDAFRVYTNLYSRYDVAQYNIKKFRGASYIVGDFLDHKGSYDYITWLFPFLTSFPLLKWGLPLKYLRPGQMLKHAYALLNDGGEMIIMNQDEKEREIQRKLLIELNITFEDMGEFKSEFCKYENKRFVFKIKK